MEGTEEIQNIIKPFATQKINKRQIKRELKTMFSKYDIVDLHIRKTSFCWANAIPKLGKYLDKTQG